MTEIGEAVGLPVTPTDDKPRIVSVAILQDDDTVGGGKQFTNLPRDAKWVDGVNVLNLARLGFKLRIRVTFNKPGSHRFKVRFLTGGRNSVYTGAEKGRNPHFKYQDAEKSYTTGGDGTKIIEDDFFVAAAGNDTYTVIAEDAAGHVVVSGALVTERLIYVVELKMRGLTSCPTSMSGLTGEYARHKIKVVPLAAVEMDHLSNISRNDADEASFMSKARTAYGGSTGPSKEPYVIAMAYTDHLAVKDTSQEIYGTGFFVGPGKSDVQVRVLDHRELPPVQKHLWHDVVSGEGWFVSGNYLAYGAAAGSEVPIAEADCTPVPRATGSPYWAAVRVKVSGLPAGKGKITLKVNWVNRMRAGYAAPKGNIVCICTRAWWTALDTPHMNQVMTHEIGHKVGMVANGSGKGPDKVATYYEEKGHIGPHCHHGLPVQARYESDIGDCVMFGASAASPFCANCVPAVLKLDISEGWSAF